MINLIQNPYTRYYYLNNQETSPLYKLPRDVEKQIIEFIQKKDIVSIAKILPYIDAIQIQTNHSIIYEAVATGDQELVSFLLKKGFRPDLWDHHCPLIKSIELGFVNISVLLINQHRDNLSHPQDFEIPLESMSTFINVCYSNKETPLLIATSRGYVELAKFLIENEADINLQNCDGNNALHLAAFNKITPLINLLLNKHVDLNQVNKSGISPLGLLFQHKHEEKQLDFFTRILKINMHILKICIGSNQLDSVKYFIEKHKFELPEDDGQGTASLLHAKIFSKDIYKYLKGAAWQPYAFNKEFFERCLLAHISNTGGFTDITLKGKSAKTVRIKVEGFLETHFYHFMSKRLKEFRDIPNLDKNLIDNLRETAAFNATSPPAAELLKRWQDGNPIYLNAGTGGHSIGVLIFNKEIVVCNLWPIEFENYSTYRVFSFQPVLLTENILKRIGFEGGSVLEKVIFLKTELPFLLKGKKLFFHKLLEGYKAYPQKTGNCTWINTQGLQFPHAVLFEMKKLGYSRTYSLQGEVEALIERQSNLNEHLLSYYQYYLSNKAIRRINQGTSDYEPDYPLVSRAFTFCYPYSNVNLAPSLMKLWKSTEKIFLKCMPKKFIQAFKEQKHEYACIDHRLTQINNLLTEINPQLPLPSQSEDGIRPYEGERAPKRRKIAHEQQTDESVIIPLPRHAVSTDLPLADLSSMGETLLV